MYRIAVDFNNMEDENVVAIIKSREIPSEILKEGNRIVVYMEGLEYEAILRHGDPHEWVGDLIEDTGSQVMGLEADNKLTLELVKDTMTASGITNLAWEPDMLSGYSSESGLTFKSYRYKDEDNKKHKHPVGSELAYDDNWDVAVRIDFRYPCAKSKLCQSQFSSFLKTLAETSKANFVFYEDDDYDFATAARDANGLRFIKRFWQEIS